MTKFAQFTPPENNEGDRYKPIDHVGAVLIVKVKEHKLGIITENSPEGGPGVIVDLVDLTDEHIYRDVLWMGGAMVDGLRGYVNQFLVIKIEARKSKSGRSYPTPVAADDKIADAQAFITKNGDPFAPTVSSIGDDKEPPF